MLADAMTGSSPTTTSRCWPISVGPTETGLTASIRLTDDHLAPAAARRFSRATLIDWVVPHDAIDTPELCVSELVTTR
jgi:hypothetical protein